MKQTLIAKMLTGPNGGVSSKRTTMFVLLLVFIVGYFTNLFTGKHPSELFMEQLYYLLLTSFAAVFGDNIVKATKDIKIARKDTPEVNVSVNKTQGDITQVTVPDKIETETK
ncbi:MAG: hypothetical protein ACTHLE_04190 [Agriterribacter sp.]